MTLSHFTSIMWYIFQVSAECEFFRKLFDQDLEADDQVMNGNACISLLLFGIMSVKVITLTAIQLFKLLPRF